MVEVGFCIESNKIDIEELACELNIYPCEVKTEFPQNSIAVPYLYIKISSEVKSIEDNLEILEERVKPCFDIIEKLIKNNLITTSIHFIIRTDYVNRPEMVISPKHLLFFEKMNAILSFDVAYEW